MKKYLLLIIVLYYQSSHGQWTNDTTVNTIVRDTLDAAVPLVASTLDGYTYISWFESDGGNYNLHMQLLDTGGYKQWAPEGIVVSNHPQNSALFRYDLKVDNEGSAIVAFQDERTGVLNVVTYKISRSGTNLWGPDGITLVDSSSAGGLAPVIGVTGQNDVVVAWVCDSSSAKWISAQRISSSGATQWNPLYRIRDTVGNLNYSRPELFPVGNDDMQMLFVEESGSFPGVTSTLYTQRIYLDGTNFFPSAIRVSTKTIPYFIFPQPIPDENGGFFVAFNTSNPVSAFLNDVYVQYVDYNGNLWSPEGVEAANSTVNHKLTASTCYVSSTNEFWVLLQVLDGGQGSSGASVQKFDASGNILLGPDALVIIPIDPAYFNPNTINNSHDGLIFTVTYGSFGNQRIKAVKLDYSGIPLWTNTSVSICAVNSNKDDLQTGEFYNNNLAIVWQDDRNGSGIFAQNITGAGSTGVTTGIEYFDVADHAIIYPNPSSFPEIYFNDNNEKVISVFSIEGKEIERLTIDHSFIVELNNLNNLSKGIYFITIMEKEKLQTIRWIKN